MSTSFKTLTSAFDITTQNLTKLGFTNKLAMLGEEIARALSSQEQEFNLRPRLTREVSLLKFRTTSTRCEAILRHTSSKPGVVTLRLFEHNDRFNTDGATRRKVSETEYSLSDINSEEVAQKVLTWLRLSAENIRAAPIRMPAVRNTASTKSRFMVGVFKIESHAVVSAKDKTTIVVFSEGKSLQAEVPFLQSTLNRLQDKDNNMFLVTFITGNTQVVDEVTFKREFIFVDEIQTHTRLGNESCVSV